MILVHVVSSDQLERPDGSCNNQGLNSDNFQKPKDHTSLSFPISNLQQYIRILPFKEGTKGFFFSIFSSVLPVPFDSTFQNVSFTSCFL